MRLLWLTTYYPSYLGTFYRNQPNLAKKSYATQYQVLMADCFGWSDFWMRALKPLKYEVIGIVANAKHLQLAWAKENGVSFRNKYWLQDIVFAQIKKFQPEALFIEDYSLFETSWIKELKQALPSIRLVVSWCGVPYRDSSIFKAYDLVLSCIPELVKQFRELGHQSEHLNHAFDPCILNHLKPMSEPKIDFSFVGQIVRGNQQHMRRERLLEAITRQIPSQIYTPSANTFLGDNLKALAKSVSYRFVQRLKTYGVSDSQLKQMPMICTAAGWSHPPLYPPVNPHLKPFIKPAVFGLEMFRTLRNSKITFNCHIDISANSASNMRLYEATGVGACLLTDWKPNLHEIFEPDKEVVTYTSAEECVEKIRWLLLNPKKRKSIAKAAQRRTLSDHTFTKRAIRLDSLIRTRLT